MNQTHLALSDSPCESIEQTSMSLSQLAWQRLKKDRVGFTSLLIIIVFLLITLAGWLGLIGQEWRNEIAQPHSPPTYFTFWAPTHHQIKAEGVEHANNQTQSTIDEMEDPLADLMGEVNKNAKKYQVAQIELADTLLFGADQRGRDVLQKVLKGTSVSVFVGLTGALFAIIIGTFLGALSGYFGGIVDDVLMWFYSVFTSIPEMLLLLSFAAVLSQGIETIVVVFACTSWVGAYRLMRAEFMKHKTHEYVQAADAIGASHIRRMFIHILPNVSHLLLVQFSLMAVNMIKAEAVLSFLGFGVGITQTSWGSMLAEVPSELVQGYWWQMLTVTLFMSTLITAFALLTDSLNEAFDPKVK